MSFGGGRAHDRDEWLHGADPCPMLLWLRDKGTERQLRRFAAGCCRLWDGLNADDRAAEALDSVERSVDGQIDAAELRAANKQAWRSFDLRLPENAANNAMGDASHADLALMLTHKDAWHSAYCVSWIIQCKSRGGRPRSATCCEQFSGCGSATSWVTHRARRTMRCIDAGPRAGHAGEARCELTEAVGRSSQRSGFLGRFVPRTALTRGWGRSRDETTPDPGPRPGLRHATPTTTREDRTRLSEVTGPSGSRPAPPIRSAAPPIRSADLA